MEYKKASLTSDIIYLFCDGDRKEVLLVKRKNEPFKDMYAIPGGYVDLNNNETFLEAAERELKEETGLDAVNLKFFRIYDAPFRDPRDRTITGVFYIRTTDTKVKEKAVAADDAIELQWFNVENLPELAFDHASILSDFFQSDSH